MMKSTTASDRCVYGYVGSFDDAIKPLLLLYLGGSVLGTTFLATLCPDASRSFVLSTTLHLIPEMIVWTHLIFPPAVNKSNDRGRWTIRWSFFLGSLVLLFGPVNHETGTIGRLVMGTYMIMSGISDTLGVWLGLVMMVRRSHRGVRRFGAAFIVHGLSFHLTAYELFADGDAFGVPFLRGFAWIVLITASGFASMTLFPMFKEPMDLRDQAPSRGEKWFMVGGVIFSLLVVPLLATSGQPPDMEKILAHPAFLPRDVRILIAYKIVYPILSFMYLSRLFNLYVDTGLPILPIASPRPTKHLNGSNGSHHHH